MKNNLKIIPLVDKPEALPILKQWFEQEWESHYGPNGPGNAEKDLRAYCNRSKLPIGVVSYLDGKLCGMLALKAESITTHSHLSPWAAAGFVAPQKRRKGIGSKLLCAIEDIAKDMGYTKIYSGTSTAVNLLNRSDWQFMEQTHYNGEDVSIYEKAL